MKLNKEQLENLKKFGCFMGDCGIFSECEDTETQKANYRNTVA